MKAFTRGIYGGPNVMTLSEVEKPIVKAGHLLVKVMANSANPADWHILRGEPYFARLTYGLWKPKQKIPGSDFSGIIEAVGSDVTSFRVGDKVFGSTLAGGAFAQYISIPAAACGTMPAEASYEEMACVPIAALTAMQALVKHGQLTAGESVLVNGATGGVGHFAVQMAKAVGARVTAVCSARNEQFVREMGADMVVAYDKEDIHRHQGRYDLVVDVHGNLSLRDYKRMGHRGVMVGFTSMKHMLSLLLKAATGRLPVRNFTVDINRHDLNELASLVQQKQLKPHIEKTYSHQHIPSAIAHIENMHTRGKVVMKWPG